MADSESVYEITIANSTSHKVQVSGTRHVKTGKWSKKIAKVVEPNEQVDGSIVGKGKISGSFKIEVNGDTFNCTYAYEVGVSEPTFSCSCKNSKSGLTVGNQAPPSLREDGTVVVRVDVAETASLETASTASGNAASSSSSTYQITVVNKTSKPVQIAKPVSSGEWEDPLKPVIAKNGSSDTAKIVTSPGVALTGTFQLKCFSDIFSCSFAYEAGVTQPKFFALQLGSAKSIAIKCQPMETQPGMAEAMVVVQPLIAPKATSTYQLVLFNKTGGSVKVSDQDASGEGLLRPEFPTSIDKDGYPHYAKVKAEGAVEGSFKVIVGNETFECSYSYDTNTSSAPTFVVASPEESNAQLLFQPPVAHSGIAIVMVAVVSSSVPSEATENEEKTATEDEGKVAAENENKTENDVKSAGLTSTYEITISNKSQLEVQVLDQTNFGPIPSPVQPDSDAKGLATAEGGTVEGSFRISASLGDSKPAAAYQCSFSYNANSDEPPAFQMDTLSENYQVHLDSIQQAPSDDGVAKVTVVIQQRPPLEVVPEPQPDEDTVTPL